MKQKFQITKNTKTRQLIIQEYAVLTGTLRRKDFPGAQDDEFSLLCEETYESEIIVSSIPKGMNTLIATLRTNNIFPIEPYITKIAESVMALYNSSKDGSVELFFDDIDLVSD